MILFSIDLDLFYIKTFSTVKQHFSSPSYEAHILNNIPWLEFSSMLSLMQSYCLEGICETKSYEWYSCKLSLFTFHRRRKFWIDLYTYISVSQMTREILNLLRLSHHRLNWDITE